LTQRVRDRRNPTYAEPPSAFRRHITADLLDKPWDIEARPKIVNESGMVTPTFPGWVKNLRPLPVPISLTTPENSLRGSSSSSKEQIERLEANLELGKS
jgi:hypothetical protein